MQVRRKKNSIPTLKTKSLLFTISHEKIINSADDREEEGLCIRT
jgi:hypothetical protein